MAESFSWMEGNIYLWTGAAAPSTSAVIAHARDTRMTPAYGWDNRPAANRTYRDHLTGARCDVTIQAAYTVDNTIMKIHESATAINMKFLHANGIGSGGYFLYSGRINSLAFAGNDRQLYVYTMNAYFNSWSAF